MRVTPLQAEIGFAARDKERALSVKDRAFKNRRSRDLLRRSAGLDGQFVEDIDVMHLASGGCG